MLRSDRGEITLKGLTKVSISCLKKLADKLADKKLADKKWADKYNSFVGQYRPPKSTTDQIQHLSIWS
ncbi:MAG: hypothetical protein ACK5Y6_08540 [Pseudomonadota bacterium]